MRIVVNSIVAVVLAASTSGAQQDSSRAANLTAEWRGIDSTVVRLLLTKRGVKRRTAADSLMSRIGRANALLDGLLASEPFGARRNAWTVLRIDSIMLDNAGDLQHRPCLNVDPARVDSLFVSALARKASSEQCVLDDLSARRVERQTLLSALLEASRQEEVMRTLADAVTQRFARVEAMLDARRPPTDSVAIDALFRTLNVAVDATKALRDSLSLMRDDTKEFAREWREFKRHSVQSCQCRGNGPSARPGVPEASGSVGGERRRDSEARWRNPMVAGLVGAIVGGAIGARLAR